MDLNELFPVQKRLDEHIEKKKNLHGQDLLKKKVVALICELHELINELQFFKFWKTDIKIDGEKALEEYVDTIHFVISIANDIGYTSHKYVQTQPRDLNDLVIGITNAITVLSISPNKDLMESILNNIIALGYQLGFDETTVIEAYHAKNKENYERQKVGY